jgi:hypothetical protein
MMGKVILHEPCGRCGSEFGFIETTELHRKLSCYSCKKYIKFVGKNDIYESADDIVDNPSITLEEINFKLDLILDNLNIRVKG